jgi:hypothetical protein
MMTNIECEVEETDLKTVEDNLSEFLPIQKRPGNTNKRFVDKGDIS